MMTDEKSVFKRPVNPYRGTVHPDVQWAEGCWDECQKANDESIRQAVRVVRLNLCKIYFDGEVMCRCFRCDALLEVFQEVLKHEEN